MKTALVVAILTILSSLTVAAQTHDMQPGMDHQKHMQVMQMMKDSSMMSMVMASVAGDSDMRVKMMEKMAEYTEGDSALMKELCKVMMRGESQSSAGQEPGCCKMNHEKMQGKMPEPDKGEKSKETQDKSHKH